MDEEAGGNPPHATLKRDRGTAGPRDRATGALMQESNHGDDDASTAASARRGSSLLS